METLDLTALGKRAVSTLSGGQRRRLDVALGLMHRPALLFLDEPSTGMDPQNRANLWEHIDRLRERQQTTIVLTTHYLEEADTQAERVLVIDHGQIIADDTAANLKARLAGDRIAVTVAPPMRTRGGDHGRAGPELSPQRGLRGATRGRPFRAGDADASRAACASSHQRRGRGAGRRRPRAHPGRRVP